MKRFKNILYILSDNFDNEEQVADKVRTLARLNNARVTVVRVIEDRLVDQLSRTFLHRIDDIKKLALQHNADELVGFIDSPDWRDIDVSAELLQNNGFISIIRKVLRDSHDLVIRKESASRGVDQLSMRLLRKCPCPIWLIRTTHSGDFRTILGAVDVGTEQQETLQLNRKIVELTYTLAQREQGKAHYLNTWRLEAEAMLRGPRFKISSEEISAMKTMLKSEREMAMARLLEDARIHTLPEHIHIIEGKTDEILEHRIDDLGIDVLVLGTIGRTGIPGLLIGNTVERLLTRISCSVLAVKPDGFISPVTL